MIVGIVMLLRARNLPSDSDIDELIEEDLSRLSEHALKKTGIDDGDIVAEPVVVTGLDLENVGDAEFHIKLGKDANIRLTPLGVTIINFTQHQLVAYQCTLDLLTGNPLNERTYEYFYQDVVSVSTESQSKSWYLDRSSRKALKNTPIGKMVHADSIQFNAAETFNLTTSGGTSIDVVLSDVELIEALGGGEIPKHRAEKAISSVRRMLREKKAAHTSSNT
jgi:hypothetical protein